MLCPIIRSTPSNKNVNRLEDIVIKDKVYKSLAQNLVDKFGPLTLDVLTSKTSNKKVKNKMRSKRRTNNNIQIRLNASFFPFKAFIYVLSCFEVWMFNPDQQCVWMVRLVLGLFLFYLKHFKAFWLHHI